VTDVKITGPGALAETIAALDVLEAHREEATIAAGLGAALAGKVCRSCGCGTAACTCTDGPTLEAATVDRTSDAELARVFDAAYDHAEASGATSGEASRYAMVEVDRAMGRDVPPPADPADTGPPELADGAPLSPCCGLPVPFGTDGACDVCADQEVRA
jgi:hypothetical protein